MKRQFPIEAPLDYWVWLTAPILLSLLCVVAPEFVRAAVTGTVNFKLLQVGVQARAEQVAEDWSTKAENDRSLAALYRAIVGQESGGDSKSINPDSGAVGYGQVMPENIPTWSQEALGVVLTPAQFKASPLLQQRVIQYKLGQYWRDALDRAAGDEALAVKIVASRWYSGNPDFYRSTTPQYTQGNRYPSGQEYATQVLARYKRERGQVLQPKPQDRKPIEIDVL